MKVALITTDVREQLKDYQNPTASFGAAPEALLCGFEQLPEIEVHVLSCARKPMRAHQQLAPNIWYHSLYVPTWGWMRTLYQGCIRAVRKKLKAIQPELVHGQGTELDCAMDAVCSGWPNVVTLHGNMREMARVMRARAGSFYWIAARLETYALKRTAGVLCNSHHTQQQVRPQAQRTWLAPNALRPLFLSKALAENLSGPCRLLHIGAITENKQPLEMLELARNLHRQGLDFEIHFIGAADSRSGYAQQFFEQMRLAEAEGYARYSAGYSAEELIEVLDAASALVHTPKSETFGLVVAEALARNLKVFAFCVGGVPDIVHGAEGALLISPGDWAELERAIASWLRARSPGTAASLHSSASMESPNATLMQRRYDPIVIARRHLEIYREVLAR